MSEKHTPTTAGVSTAHASSRSFLRASVGYGLMIVAAVSILFLICKQGETLQGSFSPNVSAAVVGAAEAPNVLLRVLVALTAVIVVGLILAKIFASIGQPPVIGEVIAGILLGPSLIGPAASALILPTTIAPFLGVIAQLGVVLYMFTVGLSLHTERLKHRARSAVAISHASIVAPFLLGALLALYLYPQLSSREAPFTSFALFMGVAMSITAFPVLARILADRRMMQTELGIIAISCAAADDVTAWCLLAFVVAVANSRPDQGFIVAAATLAYIGVMLLAVRPFLSRVMARWESEQLPRTAVAFVFVALLLSALSTEAIGIHAIFGAFLLGAVIPADSGVGR